MVLAAAGGVDHTQLTKLADQYFGGLSPSHEGEIPPPCKYVARKTLSSYLFCRSYLYLKH